MSTTHLRRYREVAGVLSRHGLGFLIGVAGLDRRMSFRHPLKGHSGQASTSPQQLRLACEELGPTFIKLGQLLSTRSDLLPPEYVRELAKLQDGAPPVPELAIRQLVRQELGASPEEIFAEFTMDPLASASIGQAHVASLADGTRVVVKIRRPNIFLRIEEDLEILQYLATQVSRHWPGAAEYNLRGIASEFARTLRAELDYEQEGRNAERFARNFSSDPDIHIPRVLWELTTSRVLTLERMTGVKVDDVAGLDGAGIDRRALANRAVRLTAHMLFEDGFFHADPHPGNLFIEPDGRIGLIDFGMVGTLDNRLRGQLSDLLVALIRNDPDRTGPALAALSVTPTRVDRVQLRADLADFIALYKDRELGEIDLASLSSRLLAILRDHHLQLPQELSMVVKMLLIIEGIGVQLDPTFKLGEALEPYARQLAIERTSPLSIARRLGGAGLELMDLGMDLPHTLRTLFDVVDPDGIEVRLHPAQLELVVERAERLGNRLVAGIMAAAFITGVGQLTAADRRRRQGLGVSLSAVGLGAASVLTAYLAWTGRRSSRGRY